MTHDIFICYASADKPIADAVCATLEGKRIRCWIAPRDVLPGVGYAESLIEAISESRMMVLVFSASSNNSPQVLREVERAASKGIPILPFRIQDVPLSRAMEYFISTHHWLDALTPPLERHLEHLADTVKLLLARTAGPQDLGEELRAPPKGPAAEVAAEQGPDTRAAEERGLVRSSLGLVLAKAGLRARAAASGLGHVVERAGIPPRALFAVAAGLGGGGIAAVLLVFLVFDGQDSGGGSPSEPAAQVAAVAQTPSPTRQPTAIPTRRPPTATPKPPPTPVLPTATPQPPPTPVPPPPTPKPPPTPVPPTATPKPPPTPVPGAVQPIPGATYRFEVGGGYFQVGADGSHIVWADSGSELVLYCTGGPPGGPTELYWALAGPFDPAGPSGLPIKSDGSFYYEVLVPGEEEGQEGRLVFAGRFTSPEAAEGYFRLWWWDPVTYPGYVHSCDLGKQTWTAVAQ